MSYWRVAAAIVTATMEGGERGREVTHLCVCVVCVCVCVCGGGGGGGVGGLKYDVVIIL